MRHLKDTYKLNRTSSHRRCLFANMLKALILNERIQTTVPKAKALRRYADKMITLAKENSLASRRRAIAQLMIRYNSLTPKEARLAKAGDTSAYNGDRQVIEKLFGSLGTRFTTRQGGYTRIIKSSRRVGDNAQTCVIEYLAD
jgi:large subunit ribosomal protein L17